MNWTITQAGRPRPPRCPTEPTPISGEPRSPLHLSAARRPAAGSQTIGSERKTQEQEIEHVCLSASSRWRHRCRASRSGDTAAARGRGRRWPSAAASVRIRMNITWPSGCAPAAAGSHDKGDGGSVHHHFEATSARTGCCGGQADPAGPRAEQDAGKNQRVFQRNRRCGGGRDFRYWSCSGFDR